MAQQIRYWAGDARGRLVSTAASCRLCGCAGPLRLSHIVPGYIGDWIRSTSPSPYLRSPESPNVRRQDLAKTEMLCDGCEQTLSRWERAFQRNVFTPYTDGQVVVPYGPEALMFATSVAWRLLAAWEMQPDWSSMFTPLERAMAAAAADQWRSFLLGSTDRLDDFPHHMVPLGLVERASQPDPRSNINRYFMRSVDLNFHSTELYTFTYVKIPGFLFVGVVRPHLKRRWKNTLMHRRGGQIVAGREYEIPGYIAAHIDRQAGLIEPFMDSISQRQDGIIKASVQKGLASRPPDTVEHWRAAQRADATLRAHARARDTGG